MRDAACAAQADCPDGTTCELLPRCEALPGLQIGARSPSQLFVYCGCAFGALVVSGGLVALFVFRRRERKSAQRPQ